MLLFFKKACLLYKTSQIVFFYDLFSPSMRWEYTGLQGVTGGYKGLQGVTKGYKGLQEVTVGYKRLQGETGGDKGLHRVSKNYTNFFLTRTFPDTFS